MDRIPPSGLFRPPAPAGFPGAAGIAGGRFLRAPAGHPSGTGRAGATGDDERLPGRKIRPAAAGPVAGRTRLVTGPAPARRPVRPGVHRPGRYAFLLCGTGGIRPARVLHHRIPGLGAEAVSHLETAPLFHSFRASGKNPGTPAPRPGGFPLPGPDLRR